MVVTVVLVLIAERTGHGRSDVSGVQEFSLRYAGVFALIGLTTAVGVGLVASDRIVMKPGHRVVAQAMHRGVSLAALTALVAHILLEILAHRARAIDAVVPFLAQHRPLYIGCGTVASDLVVLIIVTGFLRGRFAGKWPAAWRAIHAIAYLMWPLSLVHGLFGGRAAQPYVDWSYGACLALVALALGIRFVATTRSTDEKLAHPVPDRLSVPTEGLVPGTQVTMSPLGSAQPGQRALLPGGTSGAYSAPGITGGAGLPAAAGLAGLAGLAGAGSGTGNGGYAEASGVGQIPRPVQAASAERTDSSSWTVPPDLTRPGSWAPAPDPAEGRAWAQAHDLTDPGSWTAPPDLAGPGRWAPTPGWQADRQEQQDWRYGPPSQADQDWRYGPPSQADQDWPTNPGLGGQPGYGQDRPQPSYPEPSYSPPSYPEPSYPEPSFPEPTYPPTSYSPPSYPERSFPEPTYPPTSYAEPSYPEPSYPEPSYPEPSYPEPGYPEPGYQQESDQPQRHPQQSWPPSQDWPPPGYATSPDGTQR